MENLLRVLAPLLLVIGVVLIVSGGVLALLYGHVAYQLLYTPQNVPILTYIMGHVPADIGNSSFKGTINGQSFELFLPETLTIYGTIFLMFVGFGLLLAIARCLSGTGIQIIKILWKSLMEPQ